MGATFCFVIWDSGHNGRRVFFIYGGAPRASEILLTETKCCSHWGLSSHFQFSRNSQTAKSRRRTIIQGSTPV